MSGRSLTDGHCRPAPGSRHLWSQAGGLEEGVDDHRAFAVGAIWLVAIVVFQRQKAEKALHSSEARLRAVFESAIDGIIMMDAGGVVQMCNPACEKMFGYGADEVVGHNVTMLMPTPDNDEHDDYLSNCRRTGTAKFMGSGREVSARRRDGSVIPVDLAVSEARYDGERVFIGVVRDITERKHTETNLRHQALIWQQMPDGVFVLDLDGTIIDINPGAEGMLGYSKAEAVGKSISDLHVEKDRGSTSRKIADAIACDGCWSGELGLRRKDGRETIFESSIMPLTDEHGDIIGRIGVNRDITERRRVERSVRRLAAVVESTLGAVVAFDRDGVITDWNNGAEGLFGYSAHEVIGTRVSTIVPEDRRHEYEANFAAMRLGQRSNIVETVRRRKDGSTIDVAVTVSPFDDGAGKFVGGSAIYRDITERKRTENELRHQALIWQQMSDGVFVMDLNGIIIDMNPGAERLFGYSKAEAVGKSSSDLRVETDPGSTNRKVADAIVRDGRWAGELGLRRKDGGETIFESSVMPLTDEHGNIVGRIGVNRDITERKKAETINRRLAGIVESTMDAVTAVDRDGIITDWNHSAELLFGYSAHEAIGMPISMIVPEDGRPELEANIERFLNGQRTNVLETVRRNKDGSVVDVAMSVSPLEDAAGNIVGGSAIYRDIRELKTIEATLREAHKMQALGQLDGGIVHDFNNLLFPIITITEAVMDDLADDAESRANLANVIAAAKQGRDLVDQIMAYIRQKPAERRELEIAEVLADSIELLKATIPSPIELRTNFDPKVGLVLADAIQIQQVIMNLAANAAYAIGAGSGQIEFLLDRWRAEEEFAVGPDILASGEYAKLAVIDTGCGMDEDTLAKIFDPYFTTKPFGEGIGLGLAAVYGIVTGHGGAITAFSAPRTGTTIECYLPIVDGS